MKERKGKGPNCCLYVFFNLQGNAKLCVCVWVCDRVEKHIRVETRSVGQPGPVWPIGGRKIARAVSQREREGHHSPHTTYYTINYHRHQPPANPTTVVVDGKNLSIKWSGKNFKWKKSHTHQDDDDDDQRRGFERPFFLSIVCCCCVLFKPPYLNWRNLIRLTSQLLAQVSTLLFFFPSLSLSLRLLSWCPLDLTCGTQEVGKE